LFDFSAFSTKFFRI